MRNDLRSAALPHGNRIHAAGPLSALLILAMLLVGSAATLAQAQSELRHYLGRPTATEYVFDTELPADFADMLTASGQKYSAFQSFPKLASQVINGSNQMIVSTEIGWDSDRADQGTLAFARGGGVDGGSWFTMDASSPQWPAVLAQLKAQATAKGSWRFVTVQVLATADSNQPPMRSPIPETIQIQKTMDGLTTQTQGGLFYPTVQIPANLDGLRAQMLAYGNVARRDPDFRRNHGSKTATDLGGDSVNTLGGPNKVFKQSRTPPYFTDSTLDATLSQAAQFQAEYNASIDRMGHDGPTAYTDRRTGKSGSMRGLGDRADFFGAPRGIVEAAGGGQARDNPHGWMASDTHFRPWFNVDGVYPTLGYGAARSSSGNWHFVAVATRHADGVLPVAANPAVAANMPPAAAAPASAAPFAEPRFVSLRSHNFPDRVIRHRDYKGFIEPAATDADRKDSTFKVVPGLAVGGQTVSLEAANFPNFFLVADGENVVLKQRPPNDAAFERAATFIQLPGLADASKLSLESYAQRGTYLRHTGFVLFVHPPHASDLFGQDATFEAISPGCVDAGCQR